MRSAWAVAADILSPPSDNWDPLPHQIPPSGDWFVWLLLGGRGAGKTAASARYVHEHVNGPPCLPGVPGGHWIGIVAPTLGDAVTSCCYGPSGLRTHDTGFKVTQGVGGAMGRWSNGAEAKLFGAHSQEDVERFRSGGNRCIAEGSLVLTRHGEKAIETVVPGDQVMTRYGWRTVTHVWDNGIRETVTMHSSGQSVTCTPDHLVWAEGWREAQTVSPGDRIGACPIHMHQEDMSRPGRITTDRSRMDMSFTTSTTTRAITTSPISPSSLTKIISQNTQKSGGLTSTQRAESPRSPSDGRTHQSTPASSAVRNSPRSGRRGIAPTNAGTYGSGLIRSSRPSTTCSCATTAGKNSAQSQLRSELLDSAVVTAVTEGPEVRVYDLTVEEHHEFYANGFLVHNCLVWGEEMAAWRYMDEAWEQIRYGLRVGPRPHAVVSTTPKNRKLIKKLISDPTTSITKAITSDNPHLDQGVKRRLFEDYGGTRMGRQELYAEILEDVEGALWDTELIERSRISLDELPLRLHIVKVGVDPGGKDTDNADETGIIVVGMVPNWQPPGQTWDSRPHGFILGDYSVRGKPDVWAKAAIRANNDYEGNGIVAETNNGHDMVKHTLRTYDPTLPVEEVHASRGKAQRAEPVFSLYEQRRMHHVGDFPILEDQMCTYDVMDPDPSWSPDHMDAMVWAATKLLVSRSMAGKSTVRDSRLRGRR